MTTESPVSFLGSSAARNWPASRDIGTFTSSTSNAAAQELGLLLSGHTIHGDRKLTGPNRCGSAPPTVESSLAATANLRDQQNSSLGGGFESLSLAVEGCDSEEQLRAHPAYLAYYYSNVNLNPRLPPPLISQENRRLVHHIGGYSDHWRVPSFDDSTKGSLFLARPVLSTHKEESEDERSPRLESNDWADKNTGFISQQFTFPLQGRHKTIVDMIQEDFPRTPSPVYNNPSRLPSHIIEQAADEDAPIHPLRDSPIKATNLQLEATTGGVHARHPISSVYPAGLIPTRDVGVASVSTYSNRSASPHPGLKEKSGNNDAILHNDVLSNALSGTNIGRAENEPKSSKISNDRQQSHYACQNPQQSSLHPGTSAQPLTGQPQLIAQGMYRPLGSMEHFTHDHSKSSSVELQPIMQSSGIATPIFATAAAYATPYYPNLQTTSLISPSFNVGGYAMNTAVMSPVITGYPPHSAIPMPFDSHASPNFNGRNFSVSSGGTLNPGFDMQHYYKFYGPLGVAVQPSFADPLYMPYMPHPPVDAYASTGRYIPMGTGGNPPGNYDPHLGSFAAAYSPDHRPQILRSGSVNVPHVRGGSISPNYYGSPPSVGVLMQYPTSPLTSPVYHGSPGAETSFSGRKTMNTKLPFSSSRTTGAFSGWPQRGRGKVDDQKSHSFLEELKSNKGRRFELSDIAGRIVEFSADQHGSRFIQQKLETCSFEEKTSVFEEVLPHASTLMTDVFGNYVIQKFFEHGSPEQRKKLANQLSGHILPLSLQMYGCRVIQKALEVITIDQKTLLVHELDGHIMRCVRDQNGNHVIQKCIECVPTEKISFIISAFSGQVATLSMHPYGCRVIQRVLEHCTDELQSQSIVEEILQSICVLAQDQYGNYVTQHVLERGKAEERNQIIKTLAGQVVQMSQHKFASNVIEKCLQHGDAAERQLLIEEIVGQTEGNDNLLVMMKDQFANYVVQKILDTCTDKQREVLLNRIRDHLLALKKYTYGKHIVARVEQLSSEESETSEA